jgi:hypothetical protein
VQENAPVSADQMQQGGRGHTEGCSEQLTVRRSSPWHWTGHGRNGGHGTGGGCRRAVVELSVRAGRARERARELGRGRARARLNGLVWAEMAFSFFFEFLLPFLFIFSRVFNSNSIQVSNSNQIKYVQQFKEYLGSI